MKQVFTEVFCRKCVLRNFAKVTESICAAPCNFIWVFSCKFCSLFFWQLFYRTDVNGHYCRITVVKSSRFQLYLKWKLYLNASFQNIAWYGVSMYHGPKKFCQQPPSPSNINYVVKRMTKLSFGKISSSFDFFTILPTLCTR